MYIQKVPQDCRCNLNAKRTIYYDLHDLLILSTACNLKNCLISLKQGLSEVLGKSTFVNQIC